LSRSIDTAILPFLVSPVDAALYARSYQIIIAPLSQLQTSLGGAIIQKLSVANPSEKDDLAKRIWQYITLGSTVFGVLAALSAGLIAGLLFGEKWPNAEVYISAMCCGVLVLSQGMYFSWHLQQKPEIKKTLSQLAIGLVVPIGVIAAAYSSSMASVLNTYVFVCLVVLVLYNFRYKQYLPKNIGILRATASTSASWIVLASIYFSWSF
jgi:O-antigen/teichoic acid export membrane protein